jgi:hypothetical protein
VDGAASLAVIVLRSSKRACFWWDAFLSSYISSPKTEKNIAGSRGAEYDLPRGEF